MQQILSGIINLSKIPKHLIKEKRNGDKYIYVDFAERKTVSHYGDTHYLKLYDATNQESIYIGDFRPREIGSSQSQESTPPPPQGVPSPEPLDLQPGDLPF